MSGAMYHDGCPCGVRFHESDMPDHWRHIIDGWSALLARADRAEKERDEARAFGVAPSLAQRLDRIEDMLLQLLTRSDQQL